MVNAGTLPTKVTRCLCQTVCKYQNHNSDDNKTMKKKYDGCLVFFKFFFFITYLFYAFRSTELTLQKTKQKSLVVLMTNQLGYGT